ncbi:MAG: UxaA family hydrolase [Syntrophobacteraceae bacterium]
MQKLAKIIHPKDNVAVALADVSAGEQVLSKLKENEFTYTCNQDVPFGHKIAIVDISAGEKIFKYGEAIGSATGDIRKGDWVHVHNVRDDYLVLDKEGKPLPGQGV